MPTTSSRQLKNVCVLSRFNYGKYKVFVTATIDLGRAIAERKLHLIYGGRDRWLSKLVSKATFTRGSQVLGIIPNAWKPLECLLDSPIREELVVSGMQKRKIEMLKHTDTYIFLPGDLTTLETLITFAYWAHLNIHKKSISLLNIHNFYYGFITFINPAIKNHYISFTAKNSLFVLLLPMSYLIF